MNTLKRDYSGLFAAFALIVFALGGCSSAQPPQGAQIIIQGPANDTVQWTATQIAPAPGCSCPPGTCLTGGFTPIPSGPFQANGLVDSPNIGQVVDDSVVQGLSTAGPAPCMISISPPTSIPQCPSPVSPFLVVCTPTNGAAAKGQATVTGAEDSMDYQKCTKWFAGGDCQNWETITVYNHGVVSLTLNGQTVSLSYDEGSTAFSLGFALARAIQQNSTLASQLISAPNGPLVYVNAINTGTQYDYPWTTSCTYDRTHFGACSFRISLSPSASLVSPPPAN